MPRAKEAATIAAAVMMLASCRASIVSNEIAITSRLLERFESAFVADPSFVLRDGQTALSDITVLGSPFALLFGAFEALKPGLALESTKAASRFFVGARNFTPPRGLGTVRSERCYVIVFRDKKAIDLSKYAVKPNGAVNEHNLLTWTATLHEYGEAEPKPTVMHAFHSGSFLTVCNDRPSAEFLARDNFKPSSDRTLLVDERVMQAPLWAYRRYDRTTSPGLDSAGAAEIAQDAKALSLVVGQSLAEVTLTATTVSDAGTTAERLNATGKLPTLRRERPGTWTTVIRFSGDEQSLERALVLLYLFGFGISV
jgi:hypothetical protein